MSASALFEKTLQGYSRLSFSDPRSLTKYCKDHHVNIRAFRYWMKKHAIEITTYSHANIMRCLQRFQEVEYSFILFPLFRNKPNRANTFKVNTPENMKCLFECDRLPTGVYFSGGVYLCGNATISILQKDIKYRNIQSE